MRGFIATLSLLLFVLLAADSQAASSGDRAVLELVVNGAPRGEVFVYLRDGDVLVPLKKLEQAGLTRLPELPQEVHGGVEHVSLRAASPPLRFEYDERALTVTITAPPAVLERGVVDLATRAPPDLIYDYDPSLYLNYAPRLIDGRDFQTFGEAGVSLGAARIETSANYDVDDGVTRLNSSMTWDDRKHLRTATLGDTFTSAGPLGGSRMLGGLSLARNYALDPYLVTIPRLGHTLSTMAPATVDVYVNDVLVRRVPVDPGEFQLTNVAPLAGAGTTRYVLRDAYGQEQRLESAYYAASGVLAEGLSEYDYAIGLLREGFGRESWSYGEPAFIGRHRFGVTDHVTPGFHLELARTRWNAGTEVTIAGPFGELELHTAASAASPGAVSAASPGAVSEDAVGMGALRRGVAGLVGYAYRWRGGGLRTVLRRNSPHFSTLSMDPERDRPQWEHVTMTGYSIGGKANLSTDIAVAVMRDGGVTARFGTTLNMRLSNAFGFQVRGTRSMSGLGQWEHDVFATVSWALPERHSLHVTQRVGSAGSETVGRISRPMRQPTGIGYQVSGAVGQRTRGLAQVQGQSSFGRIGATYTNVEGQQHTLLEGSGSVVFVGGDVYFSRPSTQSFAVLEVPGAKGVRGYLNNREIGTTDSDGRLFLPDLLPNQANRLRIEQADLPLDYRIDDDEIVLAPPRRGGAVVEFSARAIRLVRGRVVYAEGSGWAPAKYGTLHVATDGGTFTSPLGSDGEFELDGVPEGRWVADVVWDGGSCKTELRVEATDEFLQDLGTRRCPSGAAREATP